jgi:hypothetical protein
MMSFGTLSRVALARPDVSKEHIASILRVTGIGLLLVPVTVNLIPSSQILVTLMMEAIRSSETFVLTRGARRNISEVGILLERMMFDKCCKKLIAMLSDNKYYSQLLPLLRLCTITGFSH